VRILILSNAPHVPSGYGVQTALLAPALRDIGHDVHILAFYGIRDTTSKFDGITVWPGSRHPFCQDVMVPLADAIEADVVIANTDAWVVEPDRFNGSSVEFVPWFPVDSEPISPEVARVVKRSRFPVAVSEFGADQAAQAGVKDCRVAKYLVDADAYSPGDRAEARKGIGVPDDAFVVGMVAMNKVAAGHDRKRFWEQIGAFAQFHRKHPEAILYLHTHLQVPEGVPLESMLAAWGVPMEAVRATPTFDLWAGMPTHFLADIYRSFDVLLGCSGGEGAGVPLLEAAACGVPSVFGEWTAMPEYAHGGYGLSKQHAQPAMNAGHVCWFTPRIEALAAKIEEAYDESAADRATRSEACRAGALEHHVATAVDRDWSPILSALESGRGALVRASDVPIPELLRPVVTA
jgi:glycosyltransferase involved in cell wall biosynthesis